MQYRSHLRRVPITAAACRYAASGELLRNRPESLSAARLDVADYRQHLLGEVVGASFDGCDARGSGLLQARIPERDAFALGGRQGGLGALAGEPGLQLGDGNHLGEEEPAKHGDPYARVYRSLIGRLCIPSCEEYEAERDRTRAELPKLDGRKVVRDKGRLRDVVEDYMLDEGIRWRADQPAGGRVCCRRIASRWLSRRVTERNRASDPSGALLNQNRSSPGSAGEAATV